jgi:hypothetical protein
MDTAYTHAQFLAESMRILSKIRQKHLSAMRLSLQWQSAQKYKNANTTYGSTDVITNKMKENDDALARGGIDKRWT